MTPGRRGHRDAACAGSEPAGVTRSLPSNRPAPSPRRLPPRFTSSPRLHSDLWQKSNFLSFISVGRVGLPALHAAALEPGLFASVTLRNSLVSWHNVVHTPQSKNQFVNLVHGALRVYDLPDLVGTLPKETTRVVEPLDASEQAVGEDEDSM